MEEMVLVVVGRERGGSENLVVGLLDMCRSVHGDRFQRTSYSLPMGCGANSLRKDCPQSQRLLPLEFQRAFGALSRGLHPGSSLRFTLSGASLAHTNFLFAARGRETHPAEEQPNSL